MDAKEFLIKFHNLEGVTVGEKQRSFKKLMHEGKTLLEDPTTCKDIVTNLRAKTYLEKQFRVDILLASRCIPELLEILKNGDEALICKIIKHKWVFEEAFRNMTMSQIMNDLIPRLSYCVRVKLLNGLTLAFENEEMLSELFDLYKTKYGLPAALPILLGCSVDKIESVIKNNAVFLSRSQVMKLLRKAPTLFPVYVEEYIRHTGDCDYLLERYGFITMLASKYYDIFTLLQNKCKVHVTHGRRITKKVFELEKDKILAEPSKYRYKLNLSVFVRKLGKNGAFKQYFKSVFPKNVEDFSHNNYEIRSLLSEYPKNKRYQLLKETFEEVYNMRFIDCPNKVDESMLRMMCCEEDSMERCDAAAMMLRVTNDTSYAIYQRPAKSIPYLKREINLSSNVTQRKRLIRLLADTCKVNNDMATLVEVVQYVTSRHKNEDEVVYAFLDHLETFDMHEFEKELWDAILELIDMYFLMNPKENHYKTLLLHYAEFTYNAGEPIKQIMAKYRTRDQWGSELFSHKCKNCKFLQQAIKDFTLLFLESGNKDEGDYFLLFENIFNWNLKHQEFAVSYLDYPDLVASVLKLAKTENCNYSIENFICTKDRNAFIKEISDAFWQTRADRARRKQIEYFFKWYPLLLLKHKNSFLTAEEISFERMEYVLRWLNRYEHLEFPQVVVKFCQDKVNNEDKLESKVRFECLFAMLIRFMSPEDFISYIEKYKPKDLSLDNWGSEEKALYNVKSSVARSFKYTGHVTKMFPLLMSYCRGDFLKHILGSLYKYFEHSPYNGLQPYLDQLAAGAVSTRKHAVFLTYRISDLESKEQILKSFIETEKNMSLQKRFMLIALFSFLKYHSSNFWELFITSLKTLKDNDKESFEKLVRPQKFLPKGYFSLYYQQVWDLLEIRNFNSSLKCKLRNGVVRKIENSVNLFPEEFCYKVIDTLLLKFSEGSSYDSEINNFIYRFLLHHKDPERFSRILQILQTAKTSQTDNVRLQKKTKKEIGDFISRFCDYYCSCNENEKWDRKLLQDFADQLLNLYRPVEIFSDYLRMAFTCELIASKDVKDYAQKASVLLDDLFQTFGVYDLERIRNPVWWTLEFFYKGDETKNAYVEFIQELLKVNPSEANHVLGLLILLYCNSSTNPEYKECLKLFEESSIPYIQAVLGERID